MSAKFSRFLTPTPYRRQFFSTICRQIWQIFDPSPPRACRRLKLPNLNCFASTMLKCRLRFRQRSDDFQRYLSSGHFSMKDEHKIDPYCTFAVNFLDNFAFIFWKINTLWKIYFEIFWPLYQNSVLPMADLRQSHKGSESSQMDQRFEVGGAFYTRFRAFEACGLLPGSAASTYQKHGVPTKIYAVRLDGCVVASQTEFCLDFE